jgi:hypothetical protein
MVLSAKDYIAREDAATAGRHAGGAYALVILLVLALMSWNGCLPLCPWKTLFLGGAVIIGFRVGMEMWMGHCWDHYEAKRQKMMQHEGATWHDAFERLRKQ